MSSALFSPIGIGSVEFANRLHVAPMCQYSALEGCASDWHMTHLGMLANSGASLLVVEATAVEAIGRISHGDLGLYDDACEAALKRIVDHCHSIGTARLGIQLAHAGRKASQQRPWQGGSALQPHERPWQTLGPSALAFQADWPAPIEMTQADIARVLDAHVLAARRAVRIGFDEIELHCAHGYLLHSFCSPLSNLRQDDYGGSRANRLRFPVEIAAAVRAVMPPGMPLGMRITGSDWADGGIGPSDAIELAQRLGQVGVDFVCVSSGGLVPYQTIRLEPGYQVPFAAAVKQETGLLTRAVGLIADPHQAEEIIASGKADMVALARGFLDQPHWGWAAARALKAEIAQPDQYLRADHRTGPDCLSTSEPSVSLLRSVFGHQDFRPGQREIVAAAIAGEDVLAILPSGAGKSLCFQLPALNRKGLTLVVSPLIALMRDQVEALRRRGVAAATLNSANDDAEDALVFGGIARGRLKLLYMSPERFAQAASFDLMRRADVRCIVIDEAHCISHWGHDFRPDYREIGPVAAEYAATRPDGRVQIMAMTATADAATRADIIRLLFPLPPKLFLQSFDRPNIRLSMQRRRAADRQILGFFDKRRARAGIVYCATRRQTEAMAKLLKASGFNAHAYHAGLDDETRGRVERGFPSGACDRHRRHDRLRHGRRQAGHPFCLPYRHAAQRGGLLSGDRPCGPRRTPGRGFHAVRSGGTRAVDADRRSGRRSASQSCAAGTRRPYPPVQAVGLPTPRAVAAFRGAERPLRQLRSMLRAHAAGVRAVSSRLSTRADGCKALAWLIRSPQSPQSQLGRRGALMRNAGHRSASATLDHCLRMAPILTVQIRIARIVLIAVAMLAGNVAPAPVAAAEASDTAPREAQTNSVKPPSVTVVPAQMREIVASTLVAGTLIARDEVLVAPQIEGLLIIEVLVDEGQMVAKGQVLARLNRSTLDVQLLQNEAQHARLDAALSQADAQIAEAEANKVQANQSLDRAVRLQVSGITSAEIYDQRTGAARAADARRVMATHALTMTRADRSVALATIDDTKLKIARTEIRAPVAGIVSRKNARLGAVATALGEPLFKIIANGEIELEAEVAEANIPKLKEGQPVSVFAAGASEAIEGRVRLVSPEIDRLTRLGRIRVSLPRNSLAFVGAFARGVIETRRETALSMPLSALNYAKNGSVVQVVSNGVVGTRPVKVGLIGDGRVSIESGLEKGELVVAKAGTFVRDGDRVTPLLQPDAAR